MSPKPGSGCQPCPWLSCMTSGELCNDCGLRFPHLENKNDSSPLHTSFLQMKWLCVKMRKQQPTSQITILKLVRSHGASVEGRTHSGSLYNVAGVGLCVCNGSEHGRGSSSEAGHPAAARGSWGGTVQGWAG